MVCCKNNNKNVCLLFWNSHTGCSFIVFPLWLCSAPQLCLYQTFQPHQQRELNSFSSFVNRLRTHSTWPPTLFSAFTRLSGSFFHLICGLILRHRFPLSICLSALWNSEQSRSGWTANLFEASRPKEKTELFFEEVCAGCRSGKKSFSFLVFGRVLV